MWAEVFPELGGWTVGGDRLFDLDGPNIGATALDTRFSPEIELERGDGALVAAVEAGGDMATSTPRDNAHEFREDETVTTRATAKVEHHGRHLEAERRSDHLLQRVAGERIMGGFSPACFRWRTL